MGDLDQLSLLLGEVSADMKEGARQRTALFKSVDEMKDMISAQGGQISLLAQQLTHARADHAALKRMVDDDVQPVLDDYNKNKNRVIGWVLGISGGSGAASAALFKWFSGGGSH